MKILAILSVFFLIFGYAVFVNFFVQLLLVIHNSLLFFWLKVVKKREVEPYKEFLINEDSYPAKWFIFDILLSAFSFFLAAVFSRLYFGG